MAGAMARPLLAALALLSIVTPAASVEVRSTVYKVLDLQLVIQAGELYLVIPAAKSVGRKHMEISCPLYFTILCHQLQVDATS